MRLIEYEQILRKEAQDILNIVIPCIPGNINPDVEIRFLEELLHINGKSEIERNLWKKYNADLKDELEKMYPTLKA